MNIVFLRGLDVAVITSRPTCGGNESAAEKISQGTSIATVRAMDISRVNQHQISASRTTAAGPLRPVATIDNAEENGSSVP